MTSLEILSSMTEEQAGEIVQVMRHAKSEDMQAVHTDLEKMDVATLKLLVAFMEVVQVEREGATA